MRVRSASRWRKDGRRRRPTSRRGARSSASWATCRLEGVAAETPLQVYLPIVQDPARSAAIVVRTTGDPKRAVPAIEAAVRGIEADLPLYLVRTLAR